jgi:hypothetical protein
LLEQPSSKTKLSNEFNPNTKVKSSHKGLKTAEFQQISNKSHAPELESKKEILDLNRKIKIFYNQHGHFDVIPAMLENYDDGLHLAGFVRGKRKAKASQNIDAFTEKALNEIGFEWKSKKERREQDTINKVKPTPSKLDQIKSTQSFQNYLNSHAPNASEDIKNKILNQWIRSQRMLYENGYINQQTKQELEQINFDWVE